MTVGFCNKVALDKARTEAKKFIATADLGRDPAQERREARQVKPETNPTFGEFAERWLDEVVTRRNRPGTLKHRRLLVANHIKPHIGDKRFAPGEAYQFGWSQEVVVLDGVTTKVKAAQIGANVCGSATPRRAWPSPAAAASPRSAASSAALARSRNRRTDARDVCAPVATALTLGANFAHNRKISRIRRISVLAFSLLRLCHLRRA